MFVIFGQNSARGAVLTFNYTINYVISGLEDESYAFSGIFNFDFAKAFAIFISSMSLSNGQRLSLFNREMANEVVIMERHQRLERRVVCFFEHLEFRLR